MKDLLFWVLAMTSCIFVLTASFALWVFVQLFQHQEILLYEYSALINSVELGMAVGIFGFAVFAAGYIWGWLIQCCRF